MKRNRIFRALLLMLVVCAMFVASTVFPAQAKACPAEDLISEMSEEKPTDELADSTISSPASSSSEDSAPSEESILAEELDQTKDASDETTVETIEKASESAAENVVDSPSPSLCDYCGSANHSYTYCAQRAVDKGALGRWIVPRAGINVACYYPAGRTLEYTQPVVDNLDSAIYFHHGSVDIIADHSNQAFCTLKNVRVGDVAYMDYGDYQQEYVCTKFEYGYNDNPYLRDSDYNAIYYMDYNPGGITCYTCNGNWQNIILVSFQPVA